MGANYSIAIIPDHGKDGDKRTFVQSERGTRMYIADLFRTCCVALQLFLRESDSEGKSPFE